MNRPPFPIERKLSRGFNWSRDRGEDWNYVDQVIGKSKLRDQSEEWILRQLESGKELDIGPICIRKARG